MHAGISYAQTSLDSIPAQPAEETETLSKKEERRQQQQIKYQNAGKFFSHEVTPGRKAALYSFGFPGLGQIYNRKYWKLPIVYGMIGAGLYFTATNGKELRRYNAALELRLGDGGDEFEGILSDSELTFRRNSFRRNTELASILTALAYGLNIIDAVVDAHLFEFDISDDLSFRWQPNFLTGNNKAIPGIQLSLSFN
jgi:hypothetical protein